jgi:cystathionine beta-lyase/cystathionine gamma-synthase
MFFILRDVLYIETPANPTGEAYDLGFYKKRAEAAGAYLVVDSTFGPPPLQDPFAFGADVVLHSGTKYFGGHSDMLCGILSVSQSHVDEGWLDQLRNERSTIGSVMGSLEGWLGLRSIRTLQLRVERQSANAVALVAWLHLLAQDEASIAAKTILRVTHASLQEDALAAGWLQKQMPGGYGPVFSILFHEAKDAQRLPSFLHLFNHATSLGGVESLIEWRAMTDAGADRRLVRVSVGVEDLRDLQNDLLQGLTSLVGQP